MKTIKINPRKQFCTIEEICLIKTKFCGSTRSNPPNSSLIEIGPKYEKLFNLLFYVINIIVGEEGEGRRGEGKQEGEGGKDVEVNRTGTGPVHGNYKERSGVYVFVAAYLSKLAHEIMMKNPSLRIMQTHIEISKHSVMD